MNELVFRRISKTVANFGTMTIIFDGSSGVAQGKQIYLEDGTRKI
jgi:hypothetical protein